jgi:hypothetical protein
MGQTTLFEDKMSTRDRISPGKVGSKDVAGVDLWKLRFFGEKFESTNGPGQADAAASRERQPNLVGRIVLQRKFDLGRQLLRCGRIFAGEFRQNNR